MSCPYQTPIRRSEPRTPKFLIEDDDGSIWTASRCQRILRPFTSRIATIRKKHEHYHARETAIISSSSNTIAPWNATKSKDLDYTQAREVQERDDPEWAPKQPAKQTRYTYSTRATSTRQHSNRAGTRKCSSSESFNRGLVQSTPRIPTSRVLRAIQTPSSTGRKRNFRQLSCEKPPRQTRRAFYTSRSHSDILRGVEHLWDGIKNSLDTLLLATEAVSGISCTERQGSRSLFATCLSRIPRYIIDSQAFIDEDSGSNGKDMTEETYSDLESLSQNPKAGWRPLRVVVRAHGITILADAILERLIPHHKAVELAGNCAKRGCINEGEQLLTALAETVLEDRSSTGSSNVNFELMVMALKDYGYWYNREHLLWRFLERSFMTGRQSWTWLLDAQRQSLWGMAIDPIFQPRSIETAQSARSVIKLLFTSGIGGRPSNLADVVHGLRIESSQRRSSRLIKPLECEQKRVSAKSPSISPMPYMFLSILEVLATVVILRPSTTSSAFGFLSEISDHIYIVRDVLRSEIKTEFQECLHLLVVLVKLLMGAFEISCGESVQGSILWAHATRNVQMTEPTHDVLARCVTLVAESCSTASGEDSKDLLRTMSRHLLRLAHEEGCRSLAQVAINAAFDLAERHPNKSYSALAFEIEGEAEDLEFSERETADRGLQAGTPSSKDAYRRTYRWEESISEWVAKTPLPSKKMIARKTTNAEPEPQALRRSSRNTGEAPIDTSGRLSGAAESDTDDLEPEDGDSYDQSRDSDDLENDDDDDDGDEAEDTGSDNDSDESSQPGSAWSSRLSDRHDSPSTSDDSSSEVSNDAEDSHRDMALRTKSRLQPQILIPAVSRTLKRCISEPLLRDPLLARRSKRTRLSNESATTYYRKDGQKVSGLRASSRPIDRVSYIDDESEDELGM